MAKTKHGGFSPLSAERNASVCSPSNDTLTQCHSFVLVQRSNASDARSVVCSSAQETVHAVGRSAVVAMAGPLGEEVFIDEEPESARERHIPLSDVGRRPKISLQQVSALLATSCLLYGYNS